jgi:hypothetical protein
LTLLALSGAARAEEAAPTTSASVAAQPAGEAAASTVAEPPARSHRKLQVGIAFLPMAAGKFTYTISKTTTVPAAFAYGMGITAGYEILPGLSVGLAPQIIFNVKDKTASDTAKEADLFARIAYAYPVVETISLYLEVLPGYSLILPPAGSKPRGFVFAFGGGCAMNLTDRVFVNLGLDYQIGYQSREEDGTTFETRTKYYRLALGGGVKF